MPILPDNKRKTVDDLIRDTEREMDSFRYNDDPARGKSVTDRLFALWKIAEDLRDQGHDPATYILSEVAL